MLKGNNPLTLISGTPSQIGKTLDFKAVPIGKSITQVSPVYSITTVGKAWECLPVSSVTAIKDQGGYIYINWAGNNRGTGLVLPEQYEIDIIDTVVVRTLTTSINSVTYSRTNQITDFGSVQSSIDVIIYQVSTEVDRGIPYAVTLTPTLSVVKPTVTDFSPRQGGINDDITIYGQSFTSASSAAINGTSIDSFTVVNDGVITGVIATGTTTGKVTVVNDSGTGTSLADFVIGSFGGSGLTTVYTTDSTLTTSAGNEYLLDGTTTVNFHTGINGDRLAFKDFSRNAKTNNITLNPNGTDTIEKQTELILSNDGFAVEFVFYNGDWSMVNAVIFADYLYNSGGSFNAQQLAAIGYTGVYQ
jgi:hypothetical protein